MKTLTECKTVDDLMEVKREKEVTGRLVDDAEILDRLFDLSIGDADNFQSLHDAVKEQEATADGYKAALVECLEIIREAKGNKQDRLDAIEYILSRAF